MARITSFGLFWRRDEVCWKPGGGNKDAFALWGRVGENRPTRQVCNFRFQQGIYILYDEYGPTYVGLAGRRKNGDALGQRLKEHTEDDHEYTWSRFSWFGFDPLSKPDASGICSLDEVSQLQDSSSVSSTIRDTEALIMNIVMPKHNGALTKFGGGQEWTQIKFDEVEKFTGL